MKKDAFWMPFTANRAFKANPRLVSRADGISLFDPDGREVLDATAGLWCSNLGHCRTEIADAVNRQLRELDYTSVFNFGHELGFEYSERLVRHTPDDMNHVFFGNSGSEAVETALKMALQYWSARGMPGKQRFIGRQKGYHGVNFGGISVGGITPNFHAFGQWVPVDHLRHTLDIVRNAFSKGLPQNGVEMADQLEELILFHGADTIAAVIVEPIAGAGGVILPPVGYLKRLKEICSGHDVLLIFDEVVTGWGRTGSPFAALEFDVTPDLITSAKGITNAAVPLSAVFVADHLYDTCFENSKTPVEFFHGYTYSCHPVACAAGMACLDIYEQEGLLTRAGGEIGRYWEEGLHSLAEMEQVIDVRNYGLVGAIEMRSTAQDQGTLGGKALPMAWERGVMVRGIGDAICLSPPLTIEKHHIDRIVETLRDVIQSIH